MLFCGYNFLVILTLNFGTGKDNSAYLDHNLRGLGSRNSPTGGNPESWNILKTVAQKHFFGSKLASFKEHGIDLTGTLKCTPSYL